MRRDRILPRSLTNLRSDGKFFQSISSRPSCGPALPLGRRSALCRPFVFDRARPLGFAMAPSLLSLARGSGR